MRLNTLSAELHAAGHLSTPDWPALPPSDPTATSRWILALQAAGGWLAALFLLLFFGLGLFSSMRSAASWTILGVSMTALSGWAITQTSGLVARQMLLVASLAGQGALLVAVSLLQRTADASPFFLLAAYELVLLVLIAWIPYRLAAAALLCGALLMGIQALGNDAFPYAIGAFWMLACLLWLLEARWLAGARAGAVHALACVLCLYCLSYGLLTDSHAYNLSHWLHDAFIKTQALLATVSVLTTVWLGRPLLLHHWRSGLALILLLIALMLTWRVPTVGIGALLMVLGFSRGHAWLTWLGGAALVFGVGRFYYDLQMTLLVKSGLMLLGGGLLLAVRLLLPHGQGGGKS